MTHLESPGKWKFHWNHEGQAGRNAEIIPSSKVLEECLHRYVCKVPCWNIRPIEAMPTVMEYMDIYEKLPEPNTVNREGRWRKEISHSLTIIARSITYLLVTFPIAMVKEQKQPAEGMVSFVSQFQGRVYHVGEAMVSGT